MAEAFSAALQEEFAVPQPGAVARVIVRLPLRLETVAALPKPPQER
jgi:hypothetical protein